ncbi:uncharacterized protein LOC142982230 [Anticarsia gemmatalis]|uniref:uncharacterized protein LOC142982230 n=1 Tax=Anticarsia gemmatalis TaxID=129554 RepID=UPI003F765D6B
MKVILLACICSTFIISSNSRLIERITDRTLTTETKTGSSPPVRLTRQADEYTLTDMSKEDNMHSDEFVRSYNKEAKNFRFFKPRPDSPAFARRPRGSGEYQDKVPNVTSHPSTGAASNARAKPKVALVKKPIPKFNDMEYDDDFQMKVSKSPVKVVDSGEHEDEDFNVDDYDFDVNHDEFVGRGKPLEPRTKHKHISAHSPKTESKPPVIPEIKTKSKVNIPSPPKPSIKKERSIEIPKKTGEKEDYYDDTTSYSSTVKPTERSHDSDDDFNDDNEESKEDNKSLNVRQVRSPWRINPLPDKFGEKASSVMTKILSILPMFPEMPGEDDNLGYRMPNNPRVEQLVKD